MGETLEELRRLQSIEQKLCGLRRDRDAKFRRLEQFQRRLQKTDEALEQHHRTMRERQMRIDALSLDVAAREDTIGKHRVALSKAKTNKEYAAILAAMNTEKADNLKIENAVLQLMEEFQQIKNQGQTIEAEKAQILEEMAGAEKTLKTFDNSVKAQLDSLETERDQQAAKIDPQVLNTFNRAAMRHEGEAMAAIERINPKRDEFLCGGCNMSLELEVINSLMTRDDLQICTSCGRILYIEPAVARR